MKSLKKIMALVIAMVMVLGTMTVAHAETQTYKITLTNNDQTGTHTYSAYKILSGDLDTTTKQLKNLDWAITPEQANALITLLKADTTFTAGTFDAVETVTAANSAQTAAKFAKVFDGAQANSDAAKALAAALGTVVKNNNVAVARTSTTTAAADATTATYTIEGLEQGYYFVQDTGNIAAGDAATRYVLTVVGDVEATAKSNTVSVSKFVDDVNDSKTDEDGITWNKTADYDIGDIIPYKLVGTLPSNYADYERYYYKFTDTMTHLTLYDDASHTTKVFVFPDQATADADTEATGKDGAEITSYFTIGTNDTANLTVEVKNFANEGADKLGLNNIPDSVANITKDSVIVVYYYAKLGADAVIGNPGNPNEVTLEYSKNPNKEGVGDKGTTPKDTNVVFTYKVEVDKVDENLNALKGAGFALFKKIASPTAAQTTAAIEDLTAESVTLTEKTTVYKVGSDYYLLIKNWGVMSAGNIFAFEGIDDGDYLVSETVVPAGYNKAPDAKFTISASTETDSTSTTGYKLKDFNVTSNDGFEGSDAGAALTKNEGSNSYTVAEDTGKARAAAIIKNQSGSVLPSTGGMGTTIFYVIGAILVLGAGILLVSKRRMSAN